MSSRGLIVNKDNKLALASAEAVASKEYLSNNNDHNNVIKQPLVLIDSNNNNNLNGLVNNQAQYQGKENSRFNQTTKRSHKDGGKEERKLSSTLELNIEIDLELEMERDQEGEGDEKSGTTSDSQLSSISTLSSSGNQLENEKVNPDAEISDDEEVARDYGDDVMIDDNNTCGKLITVMLGGNIINMGRRKINDNNRTRRSAGKFLRSRPKITKVKLLKKLTPTKVIIGAHVGTWAYRQYVNWTSSNSARTNNSGNNTVILQKDFVGGDNSNRTENVLLSNETSVIKNNNKVSTNETTLVEGTETTNDETNDDSNSNTDNSGITTKTPLAITSN